MSAALIFHTFSLIALIELLFLGFFMVLDLAGLFGSLLDYTDSPLDCNFALICLLISSPFCSLANCVLIFVILRYWSVPWQKKPQSSKLRKHSSISNSIKLFFFSYDSCPLNILY